MDYSPQQIEMIIADGKKEKAPDYSVKHKNLAQFYGHLWKSAAQSGLSRTLWFLLLILYVFFISLPMLLSLMKKALVPV